MSDLEIMNEDGIDLLDLVSVLVKNIKLIIGISLIVMIGVVIFAIISLLLPQEKSYMPNVYSAKTIVMLNSSSGGSSLDSLLGSSGMGALAGLAGIGGKSSETSDSDLAIKLVTTNKFIDTISTEFDLARVYETIDSPYPKTELRKLISENLSLTTDDNTGMLEITYTDIDKELATKIVNSVTDLLEFQFADIDKIRNNKQFNLITEKIAVVENDLERIQDDIIEFQTTHHIMDVSIVAEELVRQVSAFQSALLRKEVEIESYGKVSNIKDPGHIKLINEKDAILNAIRKLENGEVGDYPPVNDLPRLALELTKLEREAEVRLTGYKALVTQSETLKLTAEGTGSTFQRLEYAEVPEMKSGPGRVKLIIIVTFAGFFFSIFFVFMKEAILNIKNDPEKMKKLRGEI